MSDTHAPEMAQDEDVAAASSGEIDTAAGDGHDQASTKAVEDAPVESARRTVTSDVDSVDDGSVDEDSDEDSDADSDDEDSDDDEAEDGSDGAPRSGRSRKGSRTSLRRLEEEGEVAADYLEELLDIVDLDGDIDIDVENGRASVAIVAEATVERELRRLVGPRGEVLEALQELARLAVQARTGERSRLMLDVAGFRAARRRALEEIGARACQEVARTGAAVRMDPMSAFERKVVHDVVAAAGLVSESEGEEPSRRVVVHPANA